MSVNILAGNYVTDFVNNTAKTCSYGLEISVIIETNIYFISKHIFMYLAYFLQVGQVPLKAPKKVKHSIKSKIPLLHFSNKVS